MLAIDEAVAWCEERGDDWRAVLGRCGLYVTLEPCVMCAGALRLVGIGRVFFGAYNERFGGCGSVFNIPSLLMGERVSTREAGAADPDAAASCPVPTWQRVLGGKAYPCQGGVEADAAIAMLKDFYGRPNPNTQETRDPAANDLRSS